MAKSKEEINTSQAIRKVLRTNRDKTSTELAEMLKAKGIEVTDQHVSTVKRTMRNTSKAVRNVRRGIRQAGRTSRLEGVGDFGNGLQVINAAVELVKAAGGIEQAKAALMTVEEIGKAMR